MKLLIITAAFPPMAAGEAEHTFHQCHHLAERDVAVHVLTTRGLGVSDDLPFKVHSLMRDWSWSDLPRLMLFLKRLKPDAIILNYIGWIYNNHPMITFAPTVAKALCRGVPFITQFANAIGAISFSGPLHARAVRKAMVSWAGSGDVSGQFGTLLRDSDQLIVYSDLHRATLSEHDRTVDSKSILIPPPPLLHISPEDDETRRRARKALRASTEDFLIAFFGYLYPGKGVETLLSAFQLVRRRNKHARLAIIGGILARDKLTRPDYALELRERSAQLGLEDHVTWTGPYPSDSDQGSAYLRAADLCVLPFDYGVNMNCSSFSAAAAHNLPIIATQPAVLEAPLRHAENVFLCPPKNAEALAEAIQALMDDPALRSRLSAGARAMTREWFSWDKAIYRTLAAIRASALDELSRKQCVAGEASVAPHP